MKLKLLAAACLLALCGCDSADNGRAPALSARSTDGKLVHLQNEGLEVVEFWQNGCVACLKVMDELELYARKNGIKIYAVNSLDDDAIIKKHEREKNFQAIRFLKDNMKITADRYQIVGVPTMFIIQDGQLKDKILGDRGMAFIEQKLKPYLSE